MVANAEFKQIKVLNSILLKEVTEAKDRIEILEEENQILKIEYEKIKKENENKVNTSTYNNGGEVEKLKQENKGFKVELEKIKDKHAKVVDEDKISNVI